MSRSLQLLIALMLCSGFRASYAQDDVKIPDNAPPEVRQRMMEAKARAEAQAKQSRGGKPADEKSKPDAEKKPDQKSEEKAKPEVVTRGDKPPEQPDPRELEVDPNPSGKLKFHFEGQPWKAVIEWYSRVSGRSVDWRELPGDYWNIRTRDEMTLEEIRDLINRHLLARGYTFLQDGDYLMIEKTEGINTALVPRVAPEELSGLMPHEFVKTSFRLSRLMAEDAIKSLESMKSQHGKLVALEATNRIEAMDAARNLQEMREVLRQEQDSGHRTLKEFELQHVRAGDIREKLEELLGIEKKTQQPPMTPQQMQQMAQMRARQQQQNKGQQPPEKKEVAPISFVVNEIRNSIIAKAPPDKLYTIEEAIGLLDVPTPQRSLDAFLGRMRTYRLATLSPEEVVNILLETGGLDPSTTLRVDEKNKAIIASAPPWDHLVIEKLVSKLDGSARSLKVVRLRHRRADEVAITIEQLLVGQKEDDSNRRRPYYYYSFRNQQEEKDDDEFRVSADVERNWLLLWCNELEYEQVMSFLEELGEITSRYQLNNQQRVIEALPGEDQGEFLDRVRKAFEAIAPNPVLMPDSTEKQQSTPLNAVPDETDVKEARDRDGPGSRIDTRTAKRSGDYHTTFTQLAGRDERDEVTRADAERRFRNARAAAPPIQIERDSQGRLIIRSQDTAALDLFEELLQQMAPQAPDYHVFRLKYASATWVTLNLEDFFEEEEDDGNRNRFPFFFYYDYDRNSEEPRPGLGDRRELKFVPDLDSNTIIVRNATADQLVTIQELINLYDIPEPVNKQSARYTKIFDIHYAKAKDVEMTLKDVFRDLLSGKDRAFEQGNQNREGEPRRRPSFYGGFAGDDDAETDTTATFKGKLSFGVHEATNKLVVTTEGEKLMEIVGGMVEEIDNAARPSDDVRVVTLEGNTSSENMREVLKQLFGAEVAAERANGQPPGQQQNGEQNGGPRNQPGQGRAVDGARK